MSETVYSAAKKIAERKNQKVETEVNKATENPKPKAKKKGKVKKGSNYSDAKKTEHTGSEGEKAYGVPMSTYDAQTTDSNQ